MHMVGILLIFLAAPFLCYGITPETIPDSVKEPQACGMRAASFLCDPSGVLNGTNVLHIYQQLQKALIDVRRSTSCGCMPMDTGRCYDLPTGFTVSVVIARTMELDIDQRDGSATADTFADTIRQQQRRGQCDDDVLIFVSVDDGLVSTSLGSVTKRYLTDDAVSAVTYNAEKHFKNGNYAEGLRYMIESYTSILNEDALHVRQNGNFWNWLLWVAFFVFMVWCALIATIALAIYATFVYAIYYCLYACYKLAP
ncbi:hypothetical protein Q1695_002926 [Nippostrongylus brasiliensis]|nr:hypothetical protein Q1695_002926 [Nippostrongylus brasiliensis]